MSNISKLEQRNFILLLLGMTLAFGWVLSPFFGAVFWATTLAILFYPLFVKLNHYLNNRRNLAALLTLFCAILVVVLPIIVISTSLIQEVANLYQRMRSGELNFSAYIDNAVNVLPASIRDLLDRFDLANLQDIKEKLSQFAMQGSQFMATQAYGLGQVTFQLVISGGIMLYLLFFLLRDGSALLETTKHAIPLGGMQKEELLAKFATVVRATVKGNIIVAATQGTMGGVAFWYLGIQGPVLWGCLMGILSLLPAVGASLVWGPVALYLMVTGSFWQGVGLALYGALVIGMIDNVLRPLLVGKETKMPDWVILLSTLGGISVFGLNGFVIGPVVAALFMCSWGIYAEAKKRDFESTQKIQRIK